MLRGLIWQVLVTQCGRLTIASMNLMWARYMHTLPTCMDNSVQWRPFLLTTRPDAACTSASSGHVAWAGNPGWGVRAAVHATGAVVALPAICTGVVGAKPARRAITCAIGCVDQQGAHAPVALVAPRGGVKHTPI